MSTVDLTLSNPEKITIQGSNPSDSSDLINFDLSTNSKSVGNYDLALAKAPIQFSRKVRILETDKVQLITREFFEIIYKFYHMIIYHKNQNFS